LPALGGAFAMADTVMPAFVECPHEAGIISRILAGYGELEFLLCRALSKSLGTLEAGIKLLFASRNMGERAPQALRGGASSSVRLPVEDGRQEGIKGWIGNNPVFAHERGVELLLGGLLPLSMPFLRKAVAHRLESWV
jgi:hypothetical protein